MIKIFQKFTTPEIRRRRISLYLEPSITLFIKNLQFIAVPPSLVKIGPNTNPLAKRKRLLSWYFGDCPTLFVELVF